ncbi:DEAD/DEAH box helicase family protein [Microcoleus sp. FACHB-1515]|uniref:plasmid replication protein, CyRepA1 family n=1 Tax=Cyanophyceae TaxID=3028117 RepID=UPI0016884A16|nr:plasmid replication protein, CyRepA1 family [Microcoleus sp. FACHB-1515]MBD2092365.1 DEAD/DEAH box helicase family protein [Microcoleus sp. FACHB-1515]
MSKWKRLKRDCPICNGARRAKDCRQSPLTSFVHCHDDTANPSGWIFKGHDRNGFGMWQSEANAATFAEKSQADREQERALRRAQKQAQRDAQIAAQLPAVDRDKWNCKLIQSLSLSAIDRVHLLDRGFLPEWIEADGYCTVERWQALPIGFPLNFPGRSQNGKLVVQSIGILCLIRDVDGWIVGFQVRHRDGSIGRYHWVSCQNAPVHLDTEMPIAVCVPIESVQGDAVWLCDSPAIKASLARYRLNALVLGATNGSFASSPETTTHTLATLFDRHPTLKRVRLTPDAGDVKNKPVMQRWLTQHDFLIKLGYEVDVAWWGQISKEECDIDELPPEQFDQIRYLSFAEFAAIAVEHGGLDATAAPTSYQQRVDRAQRYLNTLALTPDLELDCEFLPPELWQKLPLTGIVNLLSRKGSGKSKAMLKPAIEHYVQQGKRVLSITPRVVLGLEQCEKFSGSNFQMRWIDALGSTEEAQSQQPAGSCCWDSFWKIADQHWDVLILDEARLGLKHVATANTEVKKRRPQILKMLAQLIRRIIANGGLVILCDADLTNVEVDYVRKLAPQTAKTFTIINHHMGQPRSVDFYTGKQDSVELLIYEHFEAMALSGREQPIIIPADSQAALVAIEKRLLERFPHLAGRIMRIDSTTTQEEAGKRFVQYINSEIERLKPLVLLYSPSMEVGVSIETVWFTQIFAFYFGVIEPCEFRQLIARERHSLPLTIWATDRNDSYMGSCRSPLPDVVKRTIGQNAKAGGTQSVFDLTIEMAKEESDGDIEVFKQALNSLWQDGNWNNAHFDLLANIQARSNYAKPQCGVQLRQELIEMENCEIRDWAGTSNWFGQEIKGQKERDRFERAEQLSEGAHSNMTVEEARSIQSDSSATTPQRIQAEGVLLQDFLPGVTLTPEFVFERKVNDRRWLNAQMLYWLVEHPEVAKLQDAKKWKSNLYKWQHGDVYLPDLHLKLEQVEFIRECGVLELLNEPEYHNEHPQVIAVMEFMRQRRWRLQRLFELNVSEATDPISFVRRLLIKIGLDQAKVRGDGEIRFYRVKGFNSLDRCAVMQAWNQKYANAIEVQPAGECSRLCDRAALRADAQRQADRESLTAEPIGSIASEGVVSAPLDVATALVGSPSNLPDLLAQGNLASVDIAAPTAVECPVSAIEVQATDPTATDSLQVRSHELEATSVLLSSEWLEQMINVLTAIDSLEAIASFFEEFRRCTEIQRQQIMRQFQKVEPDVKQRVQGWWNKFYQPKPLTGSASAAIVVAVEPQAATELAIAVVPTQPEAKAVREVDRNVAAVPAPLVQSEPNFGIAEAVAALQRCYVPPDYRQVARQFAADVIQQALDRLSAGVRAHIRSLHRFVEEYG